MSSSKPKLVNTEAKLTIIHIRIVNPLGDYKQTLECKWPYCGVFAKKTIKHLFRPLHFTQAFSIRRQQFLK